MKILVPVYLLIMAMFAGCNLSDSSDDGGGLFAGHKELVNGYTLNVPSSREYNTDNVITFSLTHTNLINIAGGTPYIEINIGGTLVIASYVSGGGSKTLTFQYSVVSGDNDDDGIEIQGTIITNGATLTFFNGSVYEDSALAFKQKNTPGVTVDTVPTVMINSTGGIDNLNEEDYKVRGTCSENGRAVAVSIGGNHFTPNCSGKTWSTGFQDVSNLSDGPITITANHQAASGVNAIQAVLNITKDTSFPTVTINSAVDINTSNHTNYVITGACSHPGRPVIINIDSFTFSPTCSAGSTWTTGANNVSSITDSLSINVTADHDDGGGNDAAQALETVTKETGPSISGLSAPNTLSTSIDIDWSLVTPSGYLIDDYVINYKALGTPTWLVYSDGVNTNQYSVITNLAASTTYEFRVAVRYDSGSQSNWSQVATAETLPESVFGPNSAMNVGGATISVVTAHFNTTAITLNGNPLTTLNRGQTFSFTSNPFDVIDADKAIFTAGRAGSGSGAGSGNIVWNPASWAGKNFSFNSTRDNPQVLTVFAIEDTYIEVKQGTNVLDSETITKGSSATLNWSVYGSYQVNATGSILAFHISRSGGRYTDPKPLMPGHTQIIGFPSSSMRLTTNLNSTNYTFIHANSVTASGSISKANVFQVNPQGTSSLYQSQSLLINADKKVSGASFADSNGNCSSPFMPTSLMKKKYIINVSADYVAFASTSAGSIEVRDTFNNLVETLHFTRSGANPNAPYYVRRGTTGAGYRFISSVKAAAWYQPNTSVGAADQDETVMYGTND